MPAPEQIVCARLEYDGTRRYIHTTLVEEAVLAYRIRERQQVTVPSEVHLEQLGSLEAILCLQKGHQRSLAEDSNGSRNRRQSGRRLLSHRPLMYQLQSLMWMTLSQNVTTLQTAALASTDIRAPPQLQTSATSPITTNAPGQQPGRDRKISNLFARSPALSPTDASGRQPKKLQKRRIPGSANDSAHSSQASFQADDHPSAFHTPLISPELSTANRTDPLNPSTPQPSF